MTVMFLTVMLLCPLLSLRLSPCLTYPRLQSTFFPLPVSDVRFILGEKDCGELYVRMACSKYEYVKEFEKPDALLPDTFIVCRIDGRGFSK